MGHPTTLVYRQTQSVTGVHIQAKAVKFSRCIQPKAHQQSPLGHSCCSLVLQAAFEGGILRRNRPGGECSVPLEQHPAEHSQRTLSLFPVLPWCQRAQDRAFTAPREQQVSGGQVVGEPPVPVCPGWGSALRCSPNVNPNTILHFKAIVNLLTPARSNHTTSYPLDNEQRLFSFLVPQWSSSFLPAPDWGCD